MFFSMVHSIDFPPKSSIALERILLSYLRQKDISKNEYSSLTTRFANTENRISIAFDLSWRVPLLRGLLAFAWVPVEDEKIPRSAYDSE